MTTRIRRLVLGFALLGLVFSGWATYVHYRLLTQPNYASPCDINATFNCSDLYLSRFGSVGGVSVALGGVVFFSAVLLIAGFARPTADASGEAAASYVFAMSTVGLAVVLYLAWASSFVLKKWCPLCLGTYAAVIGLFVASGTAKSLPVSRLPARLVADLRDMARTPQRLLVAVLSLAIAALVIGAFPREAMTAAEAGAAGSASASAADQQNFDKLWAAQPRTDLGIPAGAAAVVVVKFNDWQCPACKAAYYAYKSILDKYERTNPGGIKYVTKDYPLNSRCNFTMTVPGHPAACEAAAAARLAAERGKGDEMVEWLFSNQETLTPQVVQAEAERRLGITDFAAEYARVLPAIKSDVADGAALNIRFTPTYYVNGVKAQTPDGNFIAPQYFDWAIQYQLAHAEGKSADASNSK